MNIAMHVNTATYYMDVLAIFVIVFNEHELIKLSVESHALHVVKAYFVPLFVC